MSKYDTRRTKPDPSESDFEKTEKDSLSKRSELAEKAMKLAN